MAALSHSQQFQQWAWPFQWLPLPSNGDQHDAKGIGKGYLRPLQNAARAVVAASVWFCDYVEKRPQP